MKRKMKTLAIDYFVINIGLIIAAIGIGLFIVPAKIVSGGVTGIATILYYTMLYCIFAIKYGYGYSFQLRQSGKQRPLY